jgi:hypothetical protein
MPISETPIDSTVTQLDKFMAPYGRDVTLENVEYVNGTRVLRIRIREGSRFTVMDVNPETALRWAGVMNDWAEETAQAGSE